MKRVQTNKICTFGNMATCPEPLRFHKTTTLWCVRIKLLCWMKVVTQKKNPKLEMKVEQLLCLVSKYKQPFGKCQRHYKNLDRRELLRQGITDQMGVNSEFHLSYFWLFLLLYKSQVSGSALAFSFSTFRMIWTDKFNQFSWRTSVLVWASLISYTHQNTVCLDDFHLYNIISTINNLDIFSYPHAVQNGVCTQKIVTFPWVLEHMSLSPVGFTRTWHTNHHQHLTDGERIWSHNNNIHPDVCLVYFCMGLTHFYKLSYLTFTFRCCRQRLTSPLTGRKCD